MLESVKIFFSENVLFLSAGAIALVLFTWFVYKTTETFISNRLKLILIVLRSAAIILIFLLIFEPLLNLIYKNEVIPQNLVFIDNSRSITLKDSAGNFNSISRFMESFDDIDKDKFAFYSFGEEVQKIDIENLEAPKIVGDITNYQMILDTLEKAQNLQSVSILSDGIINDGSNSVFSSERFGIPFYTIGFGDSSISKDISVTKITYNKFVYAGKSTQINALVKAEEITGGTVSVKLVEDGKIVESKIVALVDGNLKNVLFDYTPTTAGIKKLSVVVDYVEGEENTANNSKYFTLNVLESKVKIILIGGAPSSDFAFTYRALKSNKEFDVNRIIQISANSYTNNSASISALDSADVLILIGFPKYPNAAINKKVLNQINNRNKPFFILSDGSNRSELKRYEPYLPFQLNNNRLPNMQAQLNVVDKYNPLFKSGGADAQTWETLPPISVEGNGINVKPGSSLLASASVRGVDLEIPLIISRVQGLRKSISISAADIWKWKMRPSSSSIMLFDNFMLNSVKWLMSDTNNEFFSIEFNNSIFYSGQTIELIAQLYDDSFNPVSNADVKCIITGNDFNVETRLISKSSGIYEGEVKISSPGDYFVKGIAIENGSEKISKTKSFKILPQDLESLDTRMNSAFLKHLAEVTGGKYFGKDELNDYFEELEKLNSVPPKFESEANDFQVWNEEMILILIVLMFSLEWFIRKRVGLL
ncbi:MAG: hypothetical protein ABIG69_17165 [Bacteroidota bacterium]